MEMINRRPLLSILTTRQRTDSSTSVSVSAKQTVPDTPESVGTPVDDDHRVTLRPLTGHEDCQTDYINAGYVDVSLFK